MINLIPNPTNFIDSENTYKIVLFTFIKFSKLSDGSEFIKILKKNKINYLHWFNCQYTNIGKKDYWSNAAIIEFESKKQLELAYSKKIEYSNIEALQVFNVNPKNPSRLFINFLKLFRPLGYIFSFLNNSNDNYPELLKKHDSKIVPSLKQINRLMNEKSREKAYMINLMEARETANYKDNSITITGKEAYYEKYSSIASRSVILLGGDITYVGRFNGNPLIEFNVPNDTKGAWQALGIIEYSIPSDMFALERMPGYKASLNHRDAGLKKTVNIYSTK